MTTMTAAADTAANAYDGPTCWRCGGPCATFKGSVHGWTCAACLDRYLADGAARADARDRKLRERNRLKMFNDNNFRAVSQGGRRDGAGPAAMCRSAAPTSHR